MFPFLALHGDHIERRISWMSPYKPGPTRAKMAMTIKYDYPRIGVRATSHRSTRQRACLRNLIAHDQQCGERSEER